MPLIGAHVVYDSPARSASAVWRRDDERRKSYAAGEWAAALRKIVVVRAGAFLPSCWLRVGCV